MIICLTLTINNGQAKLSRLFYTGLGKFSKLSAKPRSQQTVKILSDMSQQAAYLNNTAVALMNRGKLQEALASFQAAMENIMRLLATPTVPNKILASLKAFDTPARPRFLHVWNCRGFNGKLSEHRRTEIVRPQRHDSFSLLYATPFNIDGRVGVYSHDGLLNTTIISAIVLFNIGLLHQLSGWEHLGFETDLMKACNLHEMCRLLLCDAGVSLTPTGNPVVDVLYMAVTNNLAQISCDLSRFDASRCYQYLLVEFAMSLKQLIYESAQTAAIVESEKKRFLLLAAMRFIPEVAPAA